MESDGLQCFYRASYILMSFNWVDVVLVLVIVVSALFGWHQAGFIFSVLDLVRWIGSWLVTLCFYTSRFQTG